MPELKVLRGKKLPHNIDLEVALNQCFDDGDTILHVAAKEGRFEMMEMLLTCGCDVNSLNDKTGESVLSRLIKVNSFDDGHVKCMNLLINHGVDIHRTDDIGENALFHSCEVQNIEALNTLILKEVDINHQNRVGMTALHNICAYAKNWTKEFNRDFILYQEIAAFLLDNKADITLTDSSGLTALERAKQHNNFELYSVLQSLK